MIFKGDNVINPAGGYSKDTGSVSTSPREEGRGEGGRLSNSIRG
jgi:hypothetical protein